MTIADRRGLGAAALALARGLAAASALLGGTAIAQVAEVHEGTNIAVALAPDGQSLIVDLLGGLWQLPASGGGAVAIVPAGSGVRNPRFAPDGSGVVAQRYDHGQWDLWLLDMASGDWQALLETPQDEREPEFSRDGRTVIFASNVTGRFALWALDLANGTQRQLTDEAGDSAYPTVSDAGDLVYVNRHDGISTLRLYTGQAAGTEVFRSAEWLGAPSWRPGGRVIVFDALDGTRASALEMLLLADEPVVKRLTGNEDVFTGRVAWSTQAEFVYTADGQIWRRGIGELARRPVQLFAGVGVSSAETPAVALELDAPEAHRATVASSAVAPNGNRIVFAALGDLWLAERDVLTQLTDDPFVDTVPAFLPDGEAVVFVSDRGGSLDLWRMELRNKVVTQLTADGDKPFAPVVDGSGTVVAYLATAGLGPWSAADIRVLHLDEPYRPRTVARGIVDGRNLRFEQTSAGVALVVSARTGAPDGLQTLRFPLDAASNGALKAAEELASARVPATSPTWRAQGASETYVVQVGRLFDGVRNDYLRHMDIHVTGQRITAVVRRGVLPLPERVIDVQEATIYPGLVDTHVHESSLAGERLGRLWLVNGVTTVREVADDVADALERAESWASGRRVGPRVVVSPSNQSPATAIGPSAGAVLADYPRLAPSLAHIVHDEREQLGLPELGAGAALAGLPAATAGAMPTIGVSARNMSYQDTLATVLASQTAVGTGLGAVGGWPLGARGRSRAWASSISAMLSPDEQRRWAAVESDPSVIEPLQATLARIVRGGGSIAIASDAPAVPYGYGAQTELALLAQAGIPNDQVLRIGSAGGALALGLDQQLGTIEPGKLADFVVVPGDPLMRIDDAADVQAVVKAGVWHSRESLLAGPRP